jgi:hypothetical protein
MLSKKQRIPCRGMQIISAMKNWMNGLIIKNSFQIWEHRPTQIVDINTQDNYGLFMWITTILASYK